MYAPIVLCWTNREHKCNFYHLRWIRKKCDKLKQIVFPKELEDNQIYLSTNASLISILLGSKVFFFLNAMAKQSLFVLTTSFNDKWFDFVYRT